MGVEDRGESLDPFRRPHASTTAIKTVAHAGARLTEMRAHETLLPVFYAIHSRPTLTQRSEEKIDRFPRAPRNSDLS